MVTTSTLLVPTPAPRSILHPNLSFQSHHPSVFAATLCITPATGPRGTKHGVTKLNGSAAENQGFGHTVVSRHLLSTESKNLNLLPDGQSLDNVGNLHGWSYVDIELSILAVLENQMSSDLNSTCHTFAGMHFDLLHYA